MTSLGLRFALYYSASSYLVTSVLPPLQFVNFLSKVMWFLIFITCFLSHGHKSYARVTNFISKPNSGLLRFDQYAVE